MRRCITRWTSPDSSHTRYLPRRSSRSIRRPFTALAISHGRRRRAPARVEDLDLADAPALDARARAGGGSSRPRAARASDEVRRRSGRARPKVLRPGQLSGAPLAAASSHSSTLAPTSASSPSARRPSCPSNVASRGANSRVWSLPGWAGSQPWSAVSTSMSPGLIASSQRATAASISRRAAWNPAVSLRWPKTWSVSTRFVKTSPSSELAEQALGRLDARGVVRCGMVGRDAAAVEDLPDLADGVDLAPPLRQLVQVRARRRVERVVAPPRRALERAGSPRNGRAITRPTACSPRSSSRAAAQYP